MAVEHKKPDFSGYWRLVKTENFEKFLKDIGLPWTLRRAALRFGACTVDIVRRSGPGSFVITSLCAKGSWTRTVDTARTLKQQNVLGETCVLTTAWEESVLVTTMEGSTLGVLTSARFMAGPTMVVRTSVRLPGAAREAVMHWYYDRMLHVEERVCGGGAAELQSQLSCDQRCVQRATARGNAYLRSVLLDWDRWRSPADDFVHVPAPTFSHAPSRTSASVHGHARQRSTAAAAAAAAGLGLSRYTRGSPAPGSNAMPGSTADGGVGGGGGAALSPRSPRSLSKSPSDASLSALGAAHDATTAAAAMRAATAAATAAAAAAAAASRQHQSSVAASSGVTPSSLPAASDRGSECGAGSLSEAAATVGGSSTAHLPGVPSVPSLAGASVGPLPGSPPGLGEGSVASGPSSASAPPRHKKSPSTDSRLGLSAASDGGRSTPIRGPSPRPSPLQGKAALTGPPLQQALTLKLVEFCENRGISAVVPLGGPGSEGGDPQLLGMSPEQAEETAAKLHELETDMLLGRQAARGGWSCCGLVISPVSSQVPDHLRVWEMSLGA